MDEATWLTSTDPAALLVFLCDTHPRSGQPTQMMPSERKLRLFAVACCRSCWSLLTDERSRRAVEVAEEAADGKATSLVLDFACGDAARCDKRWTHPRPGEDNPFNAAEWCATREVIEGGAVEGVLRYLPTHRSEQAALLRSIVGNVFRPVEGDCPWLTDTVQALATAAYSERQPDGALDPDRLAILADCLEDAGCDDERILRHLRGDEWHCWGPDGSVWNRWQQRSVPFFRGDWCVDLLLGKS